MAVHQPAGPANSQVQIPRAPQKTNRPDLGPGCVPPRVYSFTVKLDEKSRPLFRESSDSLAGLFSNINFKMITFEL